jgi:LuxR family transcriptional regulator, quorum-sensing system regulator CciR
VPGHRLIDHFEAAAALCGDLAALGSLVDAAARELGFQYFALLHHASLALPGRGLLRLDTYPGGWAEELVADELVGIDPVHHACRRTSLGFAWDELDRYTPIGGAERAVLARAARHGLGDGFTIPINIPGEPQGSCTFAVRTGLDLPRHRLLSAEQLGAHAFDAARRLAGFPGGGPRPRLSRRERQCMRLLAAGKTDSVIAQILGISPETAHQYVKRARAAYDVASRAQLVACGLRDALISYEEAIPPGR